MTGIHATVAEKTYTEADDGVKPDKEVWGKLEQRLYASWASRDVHYVKRAVPQLRVKTDTMIKTTKKRDGSWSYDYSIFDRWVEFMAECGIDKQIDCFTMIPWDMTFRYFDEAQNKEVALKTTTSAADYKELWTAFLTSFAAHLQEKGWFEKTMIAMDERDVTNMLEAYSIAQEAVPDFRMALAGHYHQELVDKLADYCISFWQTFSADELASRRAVYNSSGALVDMIPETQSYTTSGYLPGIYIIEAVKPDGSRLQFKFTPKH